MELYEDDAIAAYNALESICNTLKRSNVDKYMIQHLRDIQEMFGEQLIFHGICPFCGGDIIEVNKETDSGFEETYYCDHCDIEF